MNGAADLGGMMGFGPVQPDDVMFHADWERRALALTLALGAAGRWNIDRSRHARESLHPADYLTSTYYALWITGLERLLVAAGLVGADELEQQRSLRPGEPVKAWTSGDIAGVLAAGSPYDRSTGAQARFAVGDTVATRVFNPTGHTRLPRYARGKEGVVTAVHGAHVLPDTNSRGDGEQPQWLYTVRFSGRELWGPDADPDLTVTVEAWDTYLC